MWNDAQPFSDGLSSMGDGYDVCCLCANVRMPGGTYLAGKGIKPRIKQQTVPKLSDDQSEYCMKTNSECESSDRHDASSDND